MAAARATAPSPAPEAARAPEPSRAPQPQFALRMSQPGDASEQEAERTADKVMAAPAGPVAPRQRVSLLAAPQLAAAPGPRPAGSRPRPARPAKPPPPAVVSAMRRRFEAAAPPAGDGDRDRTTPEAGAAIRSRLGGGVPLPAATRRFMEPRFGADLGRVRVHNDGRAQGIAAGLGARALTYGRDIFFGPGEFQPDSRQGRHLIAHELTHTIQQRGVVQREVTVQERSAPKVQRGLLSGIADAVGGAIDAVGEVIGDVIQIVRDFVAEHAESLPGFHLLCLVLGHNPINDAATPGGGQAILRELAGFIPFGDKVVEALENHGIIARGGTFIDQQIAGFKRVVSSVTGAIGEFFSSLGPSDAIHPIQAWNRARSIFSSPIDEMKSFASGLVTGFVDLVVDVILRPLGQWAAANVPHWDLLMAVLGQNPVSGEGESPVSRVIGLFMNFIGQGEVWENIQRARAIPRAWTWFQTALGGARSLVVSIPGEVMATVRSLTIVDVLTIAGAFRKIFGAFASFAGRLMRWAGGTVLNLLEIILDVVAPSAVPYLRRAGGAFQTIVRNPIGFVRTLVAAGKAGFQQFASNFLTHLRASLIEWLTGSLGDTGVYIPQAFSFMEILKFVLSVMGLTWANIRGKLVQATNETTVRALETGFDIVVTLVRDGPAAAWQQIMETLSNLRQMAIDAVMDFVKSRVVEAAVTRLLSMLSPAGAFIQAIIAIYNTIMFFVERLRQIAQVAASFIDGIAAIAAGNIGPAAARVERTMAGLLTLVISFLARLAGLGRVSDAVRNLIQRIRAPIDRALDRVVAWIVAQARRLGRFIAQAGVPQDPNERLRLAARAAIPAARALRGRGTVTGPMLTGVMGAIQTRYALTQIEPLQRNGEWMVKLKINPEIITPSGLIVVQSGGGGARTAEGPNMAPLLEKLRQVFSMFEMWARLGTAPVAQQMMRQVRITMDMAQGLAEDQRRGTTGLAPRFEALGASLRTIQTLDPQYQLVSIGQMTITLNQARRQMPQRTLSYTIPARYPTTHPLYNTYLAEARRQLREQEAGVNSMVAAEWLSRRPAPGVPLVRPPAEAAMRREYGARGNLAGTGMAAPHNPDQVLAGYIDPTGAPAIGAVNSFIGTQNRTNAQQLQTILNDPSVIPPAALPITQLNFRLII